MNPAGNQLALLACVAAAAIAPAQTVSLSSLVPITAQVLLSGQVQSQVAPPAAVAGGLGAGLWLQQQLGGAAGVANTSLSLHYEAKPTDVFVELAQLATTAGAGPVGASMSTGVFVLQISNPTPVAARLDVSRSLVGLSGAASLLVDVGNDGTVELTESSPSPTVGLTVMLGPTPLSVRLQSQLTLNGAGAVDCRLQLLVTPTAGIAVSLVALGCHPFQQQQLAPTFAGNLRIRTLDLLPWPAPQVVVFGLGLQPILLPSSTLLPCLLLPSPDLVLFLPPAQALDLPIPAAVRPVLLWTQGVVLDPTGLQTTNGSYVTAQ